MASASLSMSDVDVQVAQTGTGVAPSAGALGTLTASVTTDDSHTTGTGGVITWNRSEERRVGKEWGQRQTKDDKITNSLSEGTSTATKEMAMTITGTKDTAATTAAAR